MWKYQCHIILVLQNVRKKWQCGNDSYVKELVFLKFYPSMSSLPIHLVINNCHHTFTFIMNWNLKEFIREGCNIFSIVNADMGSSSSIPENKIETTKTDQFHPLSLPQFQGHFLLVSALRFFKLHHEIYHNSLLLFLFVHYHFGSHFFRFYHSKFHCLISSFHR